MGASGPRGRGAGLNRRELLVRGAAGSVAAFAGGFFAAGATAARRSVPLLRELGGDVWARTVSVRGRADGPVTVRGVLGAAAVMRRGERFEAEVELAPGENAVVARSRTGVARAEYRAMVRERPVATASWELSDGMLRLDGSASRPTGGAAITGYRWRSRPSGDELPGLPAGGAVVELALPAGEDPIHLSLEVVDAAGRRDVAGLCLIQDGEALRELDVGESAPWIGDAVVYGVIPFAFGYRGFADVRAALDRIAAVGADTLWLSPTFVTERFEFGYGVVDFFETRRDYGGEAELRRLIDAAHARGMRVLFDIAVNHSSREHPYFRRGERLGPRAHEYGFYDRGADGRPTHYFDWRHLPNLAYDNPEVRAWMQAALVHWVRELDIDGYRFDAAWGVRRRGEAFWPEAIAAIRRVKPDALLLAEASAKHPYYRRSGFDLAYDWTRRLGRPAWEHVFDRPDEIVRRLDAALGADPGADVFRFLNNNDTRERFVSRHGVGLARAAAALLMTVPGVPCIYTGDEAGASFDPYETYGPIRWSEHPELRRWYRRLGTLRRELPALRGGDYARIEATPGSVFAFARGEGCIVAINFAGSSVEAALEGVEGEWFDHLAERPVDASKPIRIAVNGAVVMTPA